ncbi:MAG: periplasmic heavy metal sensor [Caulobacteraceae bacterium]|nr:periplasmic heavy metal sensor [Caulobacteraceae bacterium]
MRAGLVLSLALNLFLIAAAVAVLGFGVRAPVNRGQPGALRQAAATLAPDHRRALFQVLRQTGRVNRPLNQQARALRLSAWTSLAAPSFDAGAAKAELAQARTLNETARARVEDGAVDFAATLPQPERAAFGAVLRRLVLENAPRQRANSAKAKTG